MAQKVRSCGIITLGAVIYALAFDLSLIHI